MLCLRADHRGRTFALLVSALLVSTLLAGCGDDSSTSKTPATTPATRSPVNVVTLERVEAEAEGSPERALLNWWRAIQFRDADTAEALTTRRAEQRLGGAAQLRQAVRLVGDGLPNVMLTDRVSTGPERVSLRAFALSYDARGREASRSPVSFALERTAHAWKIDDVTYLNKLARTVRKGHGEG